MIGSGSCAPAIPTCSSPSMTTTSSGGSCFGSLDESEQAQVNRTRATSAARRNTNDGCMRLSTTTVGENESVRDRWETPAGPASAADRGDNVLDGFLAGTRSD